MRKLLKAWFSLPDDPGVSALARKLRIRKHQIYEMVSLMTTEHSRQFLDELNQHHGELDRLRSAARVFVLYKKHGPDRNTNWRKGWESDHESLELELVATRDDLEITLRLLPHLDIKKRC
ncbi:MAG: hypothetical protein JKY94_01245 [Rhodobacteraceae bacterium]|nr:hypothetical protein [Paracoccaceae bacterium]